MSLARGLWVDSTDLTQAALDHPFVRGLRVLSTWYITE